VRIFKRFIPPLGGMDFSPLVALVVLQIVARFLLVLF
jgi:YggT family protein